MSGQVAAIESETGKSPSKGLGVGLWIAQAVLALLFGIAGIMKSTMPVAELAKNIPWAPDVPEWLLRFIGVSELAGALGLVLPSLTRIRPGLTPLAGAGLATAMILAIAFHLSRGEYQMIGGPLVLGALAAFVAWGRSRKAPIAPRRH